jgi:hypothetical protein
VEWEQPQAAALEYANENKALCQKMKLKGGQDVGDEHVPE